MTRTAVWTWTGLVGALCALMTAPAPAQIEREFGNASHLILPQRRAWAMHGTESVQVEAVHAQVRIVEGTARTTLDVAIRNPGGRDAESVVLLPVPDGAVVHSFAFEGAAAEPTAELLPADRARALYDSIVSRLRDPALLEFAGYRLVRTSVFPVPAGGTQRVQLSYDQVLDRDGARTDYILPRSESLDARTPWRITATLATRDPLSMIYSPSHTLTTKKRDGRHATISAVETDEPGAFRLSWLTETQGVSASLFAYPDPKVGGGYFLLMAGQSDEVAERARGIKREVILVLDRSGSMAGGKLEQATQAALQIVEGLEDGERFNVLDYSNHVERFDSAPVEKSAGAVKAAREYLAALKPHGGTNIHDALVEAVSQPTSDGYLPLVLFLTDGMPTVGSTSESDIAAALENGNHASRRIFTFGVGDDVNAPLLDRISDTTRAVSVYVQPKEDVELAVARTFKRMHGPTLADLTLKTFDGQGNEDTRRVRERAPNALPDLFDGDSLIVLGRYVGTDPLHFELTGRSGTDTRTYRFDFTLDKATTRNAFVSRLWAGRRINELTERIRRMGADPTVLAGQGAAADPRFNELTDEILRLSTEFGILSEYTSFLAREGSDLGNWGALLMACNNELEQQAVINRSGRVAVQNGMNFNDRKLAVRGNPRNIMWSDNLQKVESVQVQQIRDRAFFKQGARWVDARCVAKGDGLEPEETIFFGSDEHVALLQRLVGEGRQATLSLDGEILLELEGRRVLIRDADPEITPEGDGGSRGGREW